MQWYKYDKSSYTFAIVWTVKIPAAEEYNADMVYHWFRNISIFIQIQPVYRMTGYIDLQHSSIYTQVKVVLIV